LERQVFCARRLDGQTDSSRCDAYDHLNSTKRSNYYKWLDEMPVYMYMYTSLYTNQKALDALLLASSKLVQMQLINSA
jgi:hypothetical protein